jgi:hypothetical protein
MVNGRTSFSHARCWGVREVPLSDQSLSPFSSATTELHTDAKSELGPSVTD